MQRERFESLIVKELSDELNELEFAELMHLLKNNSHLRAEYQLLKQYWNRKETHSLRDEKLFQQVLQKIEEQETVPPLRIRPRIRRHPLFYVAASFIFLLLTTSLFFYLRNSNRQETYTGIKTQRVLLPDGSEVVLNASSKLIYPKKFDADNRAVSLVGEAFFKIKKDELRPFIIHTAHTQVKVLGTSFNLRAYPNETKTETSLIEGALEVSFKDKSQKTILLKPKEKLIVRNNPQQSKIESADIQLSNISFYHPKDSISMETLWLTNKLAFKDTRFDELALALERKYGVDISFQGTKARELRFNAVFEKENIHQVLNALKLAAPFGYQVTADKIVIYD